MRRKPCYKLPVWDFLPGNWRSAFVQNGEDVRNCRRLPRSESRRPDLGANRCSSWKNKICFIAASSRIRWVSSFHLSPRSAGCKCYEKSFTSSDCALIFMDFEPFSSILLYETCRGETFQQSSSPPYRSSEAWIEWTFRSMKGTLCPSIEIIETLLP